jgi:hypothetical protein
VRLCDAVRQHVVAARPRTTSDVRASAGILLHSEDSGVTWTRIPLSNKLPGAPLRVTALPGKGEAEMVTESGAIYATNNAAYTWKAAVQETVDATLNRTVSSGISGASYYEGSFANIVRSASGAYVGVSSRGNFYMTWSPGDNSWTPHNRPATRRVQNLGWTNDEHIWVTTRGGDVLFSNTEGVDAEQFTNARIGSRGFGLLDIGCARPLAGTPAWCLPQRHGDMRATPSCAGAQTGRTGVLQCAGSVRTRSALHAVAPGACSRARTEAKHSSACAHWTRCLEICMQSTSHLKTRASSWAMRVSC